jgi:hypothetical protein
VKSEFCKNTCTPKLIDKPFTIPARIWKQPEYPPTDAPVKKKV